MFKVFTAVLTVLAILAARLVLKLPLLPYRAVRGLMRSRSAPA